MCHVFYCINKFRNFNSEFAIFSAKESVCIPLCRQYLPKKNNWQSTQILHIKFFRFSTDARFNPFLCIDMGTEINNNNNDKKQGCECVGP